MQHYAESVTCLRARILDYFGDEGHAPACGNCGPCVAPPVAATTAVDEAEGALFQSLRAVRRRFAEEANVPPFVIFSDATLREMAAKRPQTRADMLAVGGVGNAKWERYGEAFLSVTRAAAPPATPAAVSPVPSAPPAQAPFRSRDGKVLGNTLRRTWELHREGLTIKEIGERRGLAERTVAAHLADLVAVREIEEIDPWVDEVTLGRIRRAAESGPVGALTPLYLALGETVTYEQLAIARAFLNR
jgi:ATP-dependent DNA helicase RecQ